jgi:UDPglucose--hexose-1-phosphate uridylyltransferase
MSAGPAQGPGAQRRRNLLTGEWVLVSPHRLLRPWQGETSAPAPAAGPAHDPACYLCPRNPRAGGEVNPDYAGVWIFDNDFPALPPSAPDVASDALFEAGPATGVCRVICYSPDHSRAMSAMSVGEIAAVVDAWAGETAALMARPEIAAVTVFENRGEMMGASNPHPHGQIWATDWTPDALARELPPQRLWRRERGRPLLMEYVERELEAGERIVLANAHWAALVPFWAAWPFETLIVPLRPAETLPELAEGERASLAAALSALTRLYDKVFDAPFPYTLGWHQRPKEMVAGEGFVVHAHVYPPLLRSASVRKFMVGFEMLGSAQRDLTPEAAAARLREALAKAG